MTAGSTRPETQRESLLSSFPPHSRKDWREAAEALLKGKSLASLETKLSEGIELEPLYRADDIEDLPHLGSLPGEVGSVRGAHLTGYLQRRWIVSQLFGEARAEDCAAAIEHDLSRGCDEISLALDAPSRVGLDADMAVSSEVGLGGLSLSSREDLDRALAPLDLATTPIAIQPGGAGLEIGALFFAHALQRNIPQGALEGCLGNDPLGALLEGELHLPLDRAFAEMIELTRYARAHAPNLQTILVGAYRYRDAGAHAVQELAYALATGVSYLRSAEKSGLPLEEAARAMRFALALGGNFFVEIAKLRAARHVWAKVLSAFGVDDVPMVIHARTSRFNKTRLDPYVNLLRGTTEAFSAVIGGVDGLQIAPFDAEVRPADEFSRRTARNTQLVLAEECDLRQVIDPAGGSYYVEWLTDRVGRAAWESFQQIEAAGGMTEALLSGRVQEAVGDAAREERAHLARRRAVLVGTNLYANSHEKPLAERPLDHEAHQRQRNQELAKLRDEREETPHQESLALLKRARAAEVGEVVQGAIEAVSRGATLGDLSATRPEGEITDAPPLPARRAAEGFEALRAAALAHADKTNSRPRMLQLNLGASRHYRGRADWTGGFFSAGSFEVDAGRDFEQIEEAVAAAREADADVLVIVSTDARYAQDVVPLAEALHEALDSPCVLVAGAPGENEASWRQAGVEGFVHVKVNLLETLEGLLEKVGVLP